MSSKVDAVAAGLPVSEPFPEATPNFGKTKPVSSGLS